MLLVGILGLAIYKGMKSAEKKLLTVAGGCFVSTQAPSKIQLTSVEKRFLSSRGEEQIALSQLDFEIKTGEFVCLVGHSGCGKTTLINLMAGFERPSNGSVQIDGKTVTGPDPDHIMIFQD